MQIDIKNRLAPRCWLEIDLNAIATNILNLQSLIGSKTGIIAVVKSNAYGHGVFDVAAAIKDYVNIFAVSSLDEADKIKDYGVPVLFLSNPLSDEDMDFIFQENIIPVINSMDLLNMFERKARRLNQNISVHVKFDTGMSRLGISWREVGVFVDEIKKSKRINLKGVFTHFAHAEDVEFTRLQASRFEDLIKPLAKEGFDFRLHAANSSVTLRNSSCWYDHVRVGLMIYGVYPDSGVKNRIQLKQSMALKTRLMQAKRIKKGDYAGYSCTYKAPVDMQIGIVPIGYAQGLPWSFSNRGFVLFRGRRIPILGRVSMDQTIIDLRGFEDPKTGEEVVIMGRQGTEYLKAEEIAELAGTIPYEILCNFGRIKDRVYISGNV